MWVSPLSHRIATLSENASHSHTQSTLVRAVQAGGSLSLAASSFRALKEGGKTEASRGLPTASSQDPGVGGSGGSQ